MLLIRVGEQFLNMDQLIRAKVVHEGHALVLSLLFATPQAAREELDDPSKPYTVELTGQRAHEMIKLLDSMCKATI